MAAVTICAGVALLANGSVAAEPHNSDPDLKLHTTSIGLRRLKRGEWGIRGAEVVNKGDAPVEVLVNLTFERDPLLEFSRRVWLPPHCRRRVWIPVQPPIDNPDAIRARTWLSQDDDSSPNVEIANDDALIDSETLAEAQPPLTVFVADDEADAIDAVSKAREMVVALRLAAGLPRNLTEVAADDIPAFALGLEAADELVLFSNRVADSPAALMTVATWLQRGGRLWIPLDRIELRTVQLLMSDAVQITEIDRVRLSDVELYNRIKGQPSGQRRAHDEPVEMIHVLASDVEVLHEVDGWPASFWLPVGQGQVLFTTLAPDAWMRPRLPHEQVEQLERNSLFVAEDGLDELATLMTRPLDPPPLSDADFVEYLSGDLGRRVPARGTILTIFGLFWTVWLGVGIGMLRTARSERLAFAGPMLAVLAAAPLAVLGHQLRSATPAMAAVAEFVQTGAGPATVHSSGAMTLFVPEPTETEVEARRMRVLLPKRGRLDGTRRRLHWTDLEESRWESLTLPTGLMAGATEQHFSMGTPVLAIATFGPDGLFGHLEAEGYAGFADSVIATTAPQALAVRLQPDGDFAAGSQDLLGAGSYLKDVLLTDEQRRRNEIYRKLLTQKRDSRFPSRPTLLVWAHPADTGFEFPTGLEHVATALLAAPLELTPPPPGTDIYLPPPLLTYRVTAKQDRPSTVYDPHTGLWQKSTASVDVSVQFRVPDAVLPLDLERGVVTLGVRAPRRTLTMTTESLEPSASFATLASGGGTYTFPIDAAAMLSVDGAGVFRVRLQVSELELTERDSSEAKGADRSWQIDGLALELWGRTGSRAAAGKPRE